MSSLSDNELVVNVVDIFRCLDLSHCCVSKSRCNILNIPYLLLSWTSINIRLGRLVVQCVLPSQLTKTINCF